jgi:hypothetical protein
MKRFAILLPLVLAATVQAGEYDQPYGIITTDTMRSADTLLRPVIVNRVDGKTSTRSQTVVEPGKRSVTVDLPARQGFNQATQETFELDVKPCVRYYVVAKLESSLGQKWTPLIRSEERIGECAAKFKLS